MTVFRSLSVSRFAPIAAVAGIMAIVSLAPANAQAPLKPDVSVEALMKTGELPDVVLGKEDAPYTIIEYSSMTCPHCANFHLNVLPEVKKKYIDTGIAKYIIREFPFDNVAAAAFMLARCVDQSKYFDFVDLLYEKQEEWAFGGEPLPGLQKYAKQAGFTEARFNECLRDEKLLKHVEWVRNRGHSEFGVRATPTFFINGKQLDNSSISAFDEIMENASPEKS
ncbi:MAG: DsbA family protein [Hyphomicrobiales bacterium]|nr:DsbA family protein [Hyphomicrobiales bacterium]